jgi:hypothetical protein
LRVEGSGRRVEEREETDCPRLAGRERPGVRLSLGTPGPPAFRFWVSLFVFFPVSGVENSVSGSGFGFYLSILFRFRASLFKFRVSGLQDSVVFVTLLEFMV